MECRRLLVVILIFMVANPCSFYSVGLSKNVQAIDKAKKEYNEWISWHLQRSNEQLSFLDKKDEINYSGNNVSSTQLERKVRQAEKNKRVITVCQDGNGDFLTIEDAVHSINVNSTRRTVIYIRPGIYREKVLIPRWKPFVTFMGDEARQPVITGNDTAAALGMDGMPMKTFRSATVAVNSDYFIAYNIRFENTAPYPETGSNGGQAVALRISGTKAAFYNCSFYGAQDTLYDHKGLHYFKSCFIQGSMDFIFGYGRSLYANCHINSIARGVAALTAQKRNNASLSSGFSFLNCVISGSGFVYLGRAWGDHSRVVFVYTYMDKIVLPGGWDNWGYPDRERTVYYGQYKCIGPGANTTGRVQWGRTLSDEEATPFLSTSFINGQTWLMGNPASSLGVHPVIC